MRTLPLLAVALLLLTGCTAPVEPNDVDTQRLDALAQEPLLDGGAKHPADTTHRGAVSVTYEWSTGGTSETWELTEELLDSLRGDGWLVTLQNCEASEAAGLESARLVAIKELGDFTAALVVGTHADGAELQAFAPFHNEDANPWKSRTEVPDGCLDGDEPTITENSDAQTDIGAYYSEH